MPYNISKVDGKYRVTSPHGTKTKGTTMAKAMKQRRLLQAIKHQPGFRPR